MSVDDTDRPRSAQPTPVWTQVTDAPLKGLRLAREAQRLIAWDESDHLWLLDVQGDRIGDHRAPSPIADAGVSDDGSLIALLLADSRLLLLDSELQAIAERSTPGDAATLAVDPHGRYVALATRTSRNLFYTRFGKNAGGFETLQPLSFIRFVPAVSRLLGASAYGTLFALGLASRDQAGALTAEEVWRTQLMANVGRLETTGDGRMTVAACHTLGIQRFDAKGRNEGSYHPGGTASHAVPDFTGRLIAAATTEGDLYLLNRTGSVRWKSTLPRGPVALEIDPLGRYLIHGLPSGEITRVNIEQADTPTPGPSTSSAAPSAPLRTGLSGTLRTPAWSVPVTQTEDQAETAMLAVLDDPPRVAVITSKNQLTLFTSAGGSLGQAPAIAGVGRILRTTPGWIAAATDRQVILYDARRNSVHKLDLSLVELTHLVIRPDSYGLAMVQEQDRVGRVSLAGRWVWKRELATPVEELAVGRDGLTALTTGDGRLTIYNPAGEPLGYYQAQPPEPLLLTVAPEDSPPEIAWITQARRAQVLRAHSLDGKVIWETPVPWEGWQLHQVGKRAVAVAPDGRALAVDDQGRPRSQSRSGSPQGPLFPAEDDAVCRMIRQGEHLQCVDLSGLVRWRFVSQEVVGPVAASRIGTAALVGRSLVWFPAVPDLPGVS